LEKPSSPDFRIPNPESRIPNPESRIPNPETGIPIAFSHRMGMPAASRPSGFTYLGRYAYSVTCWTFARQPAFSAGAVVDTVAAQLLRSSREEQFALLAYCFMPDHVHLLLEGLSSTSDLPRLLARWKHKTGCAYRSLTNMLLWQGGFHDHVLRQEEDRRAAIRYLIANPIRAGLVVDVRDYAFWGSGVWTREELIETLFDRQKKVRAG
jgi:putative transposase